MSQPAATTAETPQAATQRWWPQLQELFAARWEMARWEVRGDVDSARRLGLVAGSGAVLVLTALPLLVIALSQALASVTVIEAIWWQLIFGCFFALVGALLIWTGWRTFRRNFAGLQETLEELREDQLWLKEMAAEVANSAGVTMPEADDEETPPMAP